jgi:ABC-type cobalamin/Fe3+-siderophores transport system ATPase subunit
MLKAISSTKYKAFGFSISSEIPLPELSLLNNQNHLTDIEIVLKDLTPIWSEVAVNEGEFIVTKDMVMFHVPNTSLFRVEKGNKIIVSPLMEDEEDAIRIFILGTCMGIILMQRGVLPLHGSAVEINGKAFAIIGDSGAGKSTLAKAFLQKGYHLLTDDVIAVHFNEDQVPYVTPSYPHQKLWQESLDKFGMESNQYRSIYKRETKFAIPVSAQFSKEPIPLAGIFELVISEGDGIEIKPIDKLMGLQKLLYHTYRHFLISPLGLMDWHFNQSTKMMSYVNMFQLKRSTTRFSALEIVSLILEKINNGGIKKC